jgi:two-component system, LytTR family, sensor kinase
MKKKKIRFVYMVALGILISFLLELVERDSKEDHFFAGMITSVLITIFVWEGNNQINLLLDKKLPWIKEPGKRAMVHLPLSIVFSTAAIYFPMLLFNHFICGHPDEEKHSFMFTSLIIGVLVSSVIISAEFSIQFFGYWRKSLVEVEKYKAESLQAQLKNLKDQVNPHFLFNNLSVLSSLVYLNQDKAVDFINQLSKVYRYVLDNKDNELVTLETELAFIRSYAYLFQIRFDKNIEFHFDISESSAKLLIPPMALQILVENTIKHNEISSEKPLKVCIVAFEDELVVKNNFHLRSNPEPGSNTGLKNIRDRYKHFTDKEVQVSQTETVFEVKIPLLKS